MPTVAHASSPWDIPGDWPAPEPAAQAVSAALVERIREEIAAGGGFLGFARYMELALYAPGLGYYSAGARKFGPAGDFVTAPEISPLYSRCVARSCASVLEALDGGDVLEIGAGSGAMAGELLQALAGVGRLPARYWILERSADLRARQRARLEREIPGLVERVAWLDAPPASSWRGILVANEVLDALPVSRFTWRQDRVFEAGVGGRDGGLRADERPGEGALAEQVLGLAQAFEWSPPYRSEICLALAPWLEAVTRTLVAGAALFVDYGYARNEYYRADRAQGTLLCHYRQRAHADPLLLPGLQDITAHVDFSRVADAGAALGWQLGGYTTQAHFLLDCGIEQMLAERLSGAGADYLRLASQAKTLLLPGEMGERFKAMLLRRGFAGDVRGFGGRDLRGRL